MKLWLTLNQEKYMIKEEKKELRNSNKTEEKTQTLISVVLGEADISNKISTEVNSIMMTFSVMISSNNSNNQKWNHCSKTQMSLNSIWKLFHLSSDEMR